MVLQLTRKTWGHWLTIALLTAALTSNTLAADEAGEPAVDEAPQSQLEADIQDLKQQVLQLNRDLFILEEDLLFPANTQFSVFLSVDASSLFQLDSVQLRVNDKQIAGYLYTRRELAALQRGGVHRLYQGNLPSGEHELVAIFTGTGPNGRDYRRGKSIVFEKSSDPQFVEFSISADTGKEQPLFDARVWE